MVSAIERSGRAASLAKRAGGVVAVALAHGSYVFLVYRARHLASGDLASSDFILFGIPALAAFAVYYWLVGDRRASWPPRWLVAFALTAASFFLSLLVPFNTYGT